MASKKSVETSIDIMTMSLEQLQAHSQSQSEKIEELTAAASESNANIEELTVAASVSNAKIEELTVAASVSNAKIEELTTINTESAEKILVQESTIEELMGTVAKLDAEPKVKATTVKIGKVAYKLTVPKSYVRVKAGEATMLCTVESCSENEELREVAIAKGILVPVSK